MTSPVPSVGLTSSPWFVFAPLPWLFLICTAELLRRSAEAEVRPANSCEPRAHDRNTDIAQRPLTGAAPRRPNKQETAMTCKAEIRRRCRTRDDACAYLSTRGFLCLPSGWANGRWAANLDTDRDGCVVTIWLRIEEAA
jgi:hypothetical protein